MTYGYRRAHKDDNHAAIVSALELVGCLVIDLSTAGKGIPDLLVARDGVLRLVEIKNPKSKNGRYYKADGLEDSQIEFLAKYGAKGPPIHFVRSVAEALEVVVNTQEERDEAAKVKPADTVPVEPEATP